MSNRSHIVAIGLLAGAASGSGGRIVTGGGTTVMPGPRTPGPVRGASARTRQGRRAGARDRHRRGQRRAADAQGRDDRGCHDRGGDALRRGGGRGGAFHVQGGAPDNTALLMGRTVSFGLRTRF